MMVAASPKLSDLHGRARKWLVSHGHEADANAVLHRDKKQSARQRKGRGSKGGGDKSRVGESKKK